jgi:tetratricopeptide (TPR) repeat protein
MLIVWFARALVETNRAELVDRLLPPDQSAMPPAVLFSLGTLLAQHRHYQLAITYLERIPEQSADDAVYFNLGLAYSHLQKILQARQNYFQAIDRHPQHVEAYFHVGLDYASAGNSRFAIPWLMRAHEFAPKRSDITYALAEQLIALDYADTAQRVLQAAMQEDAGNPLLLAADGDLKQREGQTAAALALYQRALGLQENLAPALVGMARVEATQGKLQDAEARLRRVISADPADSAASAQLGLLEAKQEHWESALQLLNRAWDEDRSNPEIALARARAYRRLGRPADALAALTSVQAQQQGSAAFHIELAQAFHQLHRDQDAQKERATASRLEMQTHSSLHFENPKTYVY